MDCLGARLACTSRRPAITAHPCLWGGDEDEPAIPDRIAGDDTEACGWSERDIVLLHWRLLQEVEALADPQTPLEAKFDTLRWVFTEREKDSLPFSFVNCLKVVGCSPLSPIAYCGRVDAEEVRDCIRSGVRGWLTATLARYPQWVRDAATRTPEWFEAQLMRNPQWLNEQVKANTSQGELFLFA
jgi:hypothetical protein